MLEANASPNKTYEDTVKELSGQSNVPNPDVSIPVPNRGYGSRFGGSVFPDKSEFKGKIPTFDSSMKGNGYFGFLPRKDRPDESSSEISIGVTVNGKNYHVPSMVPGLTKSEVDYLLSTPEDKIFTTDKSKMNSIQTKAEKWAKFRIEQGLPVFATAPEEGAFKPTPEAPKR